jgi:putative flavoprotein involved in K+ transport
MELSRTRKVWMSGRYTGNVPFRIASQMARFVFLPLVLRLLFHYIFTIKNPLGRKTRAKVLAGGLPLIRVQLKDLTTAGVEFVPKTVGVKNGKPVLEDGRVMDVPNVIWCSGYHSGFSWINLPVLGDVEPNHKGGIVKSQPGLFFVGLSFLYSYSSSMVQGVGRDALRVVRAIEKRAKSTKQST